jgi:hypothetical protein
MQASLYTILAVLVLAPFTLVHAAETARPNVLFIYTDDLSYDALSIVQKEQG